MYNRKGDGIKPSPFSINFSYEEDGYAEETNRLNRAKVRQTYRYPAYQPTEERPCFMGMRLRLREYCVRCDAPFEMWGHPILWVLTKRAGRESEC